MEAASVTQWLEQIGVRNPKIKLLASYWEQLRGSRPLPRRQDIEPWHIAALLPHIWLWGAEPERHRFILGLAGEEICNLIGHHRRGTPLAKVVSPSAYPSVLRRYSRVLEEVSAAYFFGTAVLANDLRLPAEWLILPLSRDGETATDIIGVTLFRRRTLYATRGEVRFANEELLGRFLPLLDRRPSPMPAATSG